MFPELHRFKVFAYDTETTGFNWFDKDRPFGFSISTPDGRDYYYDVRETPDAPSWFDRELKKYRGKIVCHNAPFDYLMTQAPRDEEYEGIQVRKRFLVNKQLEGRTLGIGLQLPIEQLDDTVIRACLIDEHLMSYQLDALGRKYLKAKKEEITGQLADLFGDRATSNVQMPRIPHAPVEMVGTYAKQDTRLTLDLWMWQEQEIERQGIQQIVEFEKGLLPRFIRNQRRGIRVNVDEAEYAAKQVARRKEQVQKSVKKLCGFSVNVHEREDLIRLFQPEYKNGNWYTKDGELVGTTNGGAASFTKEILMGLQAPEAKLITKIRAYDRVQGTFIEGHILGNQVNGRVYPTINQTKGESGGTGTGRLSMQGPAMQQISKRDKELASIVRPLFLPDEGCYWSSRDWAQSDFRWFAHYVRPYSDILYRFYQADPDADFHSIVTDITGIPRDPEYSGGPNSKQINLGLVFGMGQGKMAATMGLPYTVEEWTPPGQSSPKKVLRAGPDAKRIFDVYHRSIPGIRQFLDAATEVANKRGYVKSQEGRRIRFPGGNFAYKAGGLILQTATADMLKRKYAEVDDYFESEGCGSVIVTVHDELNNNIPHGREDMDQEIRAIMQDVPKSSVPFRTSAGMGDNWWDAIVNEVAE